MQFLRPFALLSALAVLPAAAQDSAVVINEVHYHPANELTQSEWIEIRCLHGVDVDISGWQLEGGVNFTFPAGTIINGRAFMVIAQNPAALPGVSALGPWTGKLDNGGEEVRLVNNSDRVMDRITYSDDGDWPVGPDGSGATLARRDQTSADSSPAAWATSNQLGGTPGSSNFLDADSTTTVTKPVPIDAANWKYNDTDTPPSASWKDPGFADTAWSSGRALFYRGTAQIATPVPPTAVLSGPGAGLTNYWPMDDTAGSTTAANSAGGTTGTLNGSVGTNVAFSTDTAPRSKVLRLNMTAANANTSGSWVAAGSLPVMTMVNDYTWAFWARSNEGSTSDVLFGNRYANAGATDFSPREFIKFTTTRFEWHVNGGGQDIDYVDIPNTTWIHHAVVKQGALLTYYRNGAASGSVTVSSVPINAQPLFMGGNGTNESWSGFLDDVALWNKAVPAAAISALAANTYTPATLPSNVTFVDNGPFPVPASVQFPPQALQTVVNPATTHYFRNSFTFSGDPASTTLTLWPIHDDAAVYYLNGTEIHRDNISAGAAHGTLATSPVADPSFPKNPVTIPAGLLVSGTNVLAVEVHQDSAASPDMMFGAQLEAATLAASARDTPGLRFTEISPATAAPGTFRIELQNTTTATLNLAAFTLSDSNGQSHALTGTLAAGDQLVLNETTIGWRPVDGTRLFLTQGDQYYDGRTVTARLRGLGPDGLWGYPTGTTFGAANDFEFDQDIVINEIFYSAPDQLPEQWVELYNRGTRMVDLSGWKFTDGITYEFPAATPLIAPGEYALVVWDVAAFNILHPGLPRVFGPFTDSLSGKGERIRLREAGGNVVDEVRYSEGGSWPEFTSGTASSIELKNALADNNNGSAWAASNETLRGAWQNVSYTFSGAILESIHTYYSELILGLLNDGEVLIDDISVQQNPAGSPIELIQNGNFTAGTTDKWRLTGNTRRSTVVDDPDSPGNKVLKLVQGGSLDHMSNHLETTLKNGATLLGANGISTSLNYRISFRARWWRGNNALHSHLYFNRGPATTTLSRPTTGGTPGAVNSTASATATLTLGSVSHTPAVPAASAPVTVTAKLDDPSASSTVTLFYSLNEGAEQNTPMTLTNGVWTGIIPGQAAAAKANFRIAATSLAGHTAVWPAKGLAGRAIVPWNDGMAQLVRPNGCRPHNVRIVMTATDTALLHNVTNVMSNDWIPCTMIYDEREVYYGCGVHLKGSEHGRAKVVRAGFHIRFPEDQLFLGRHDQISIDRSGAGDQFSQKEILVKRSMNRAGGIPCTEDDLIRVIAPQAAHTGPAICIHNKIDSDNFLDGQWSSGSNGTFFEYELLYPLTGTDTGGLEGNKITQDGGSPTGPSGVSVRKLNPGLTKEEYRWFWLIKNNRTRDDYAGLITGLTALGQSGTTFHTQTAPLLDTDGWLRSFTGPVAWAAGDNYAFGSQHNCLYFMKADGKLLYVPWDMDFTASDGATASVAPNTELNKLISTLAGTTADDANKRAYYGHLLHMVNTGFNPGYMGRWMDHYSCFVNEDFRANFMSFVTQRETHIRTQITAAVPVVTFQITTNSGNNFSTPNSTTTLAGDGWVSVSTIRLAGGEPLAVTWTDQDSWRITLPVSSGPNVFNLEARDAAGTIVGTDSITVTGTGGVVPASSANILLTELNFNPSVAGEEFIELTNTSALTVDISGCTFTAGIAYTFPAGTMIAPGARMLVVENRTLFSARYPAATGLAPNSYAPSNLSNGGETLTLRAADALSDVFSVGYNDSIASTDGAGRSLVRIVGCTTPSEYLWRESMTAGGNPGSSDALMFTGNPLADADNDGHPAIIEYAFGTSDTAWTPATFFLVPNASSPPTAATPLPNADCVRIELQSSDDLSNWSAPISPLRRFWRWQGTLR